MSRPSSPVPLRFEFCSLSDLLGDLLSVWRISDVHLLDALSSVTGFTAKGGRSTICTIHKSWKIDRRLPRGTQILFLTWLCKKTKALCTAQFVQAVHLHLS